MLKIECNDFLSTLSLRRATAARNAQDAKTAFSIHALLAESDDGLWWTISHPNLFYPRSPCGERQGNADTIKAYAHFLSTLSLRRATDRAENSMLPPFIFYPRSPCGERPGMWTISTCMALFYPRSPCGERRSWTGNGWPVPRFLSTLSLRRATYKRDGSQPSNKFSIHALLAESDSNAG